MKRILLSWSSGKDSAWALHLLRQNPEWRVEALVTTFNSAADRVAMHAVRRVLVEEQACAVGLPLWQVELPWPCSNAQYEEIMRGVCQRAVAEGITDIAFGDLYLEDIRAYRERQLEGTGLRPLFPLWMIPTRQLAADMITAGIRAKVTAKMGSSTPSFTKLRCSRTRLRWKPVRSSSVTGSSLRMCCQRVCYNEPML
jgi:diphthamide synthase (EF-2-diphthine--ammonia ligase)